MDKNNLGEYSSLQELWQAHPEGGHEGDYATVNGVTYRWDKYNRIWNGSASPVESYGRRTEIHEGDVIVNNDLTVAGMLRAKGVKQPNKGLFKDLDALQKRYPLPEIGWWATVGDTVPGLIYRCDKTGVWSATGETGGLDAIDYEKIDTAVRNAQTAADKADKMADRANAEAGNANTMAALAQQAADSANESAGNADIAASNANSKAEAANTAAVNAASAGAFAKDQGDYAKEQGAILQQRVEAVERFSETVRTEEQARADSEKLRIAEEEKRKSAEQVRTDNESGRVSAEQQRASEFATLKKASEEATSAANTAASEATSAAATANATTSAANKINEDIIKAEQSRASAESLRAKAESTRVESENTRQQNESTRVGREYIREANETKRKSVEAERVKAESDRESEETLRRNAETTRKSNESARTSSESSRAADESKRVSAETVRAAAESKRVISENSRVAAENTRASEFARLKSESETATDNATKAAVRANTAAAAAEKAASIGELFGYSKEFSINTVAGTKFLRKYFDIKIPAHKDVTIVISNPTISRIEVALADEKEETVHNFGNVPVNQFPFKFTTNVECSKISFAAYSESWVTGTGEMTFNVLVEGSESAQNNKIEGIQNDVIGEFIPKLEVAVNNNYISSTGGLIHQAGWYVSKPISLKVGDIVKMQYNDTGFTAIATENEGVYTKIYYYEGVNSIKYYVVESDIDVVFTFKSDSVITIIRKWISKSVYDINRLLTDEYVSLKDSIFREENAIPYNLNAVGAQSNKVIDVELIKGTQYSIKSNITDGSVLTLFAWDKNLDSHIETIVQSLAPNGMALYTPTQNIHAVYVASTSQSIDFVIFNANSPTVRIDDIKNELISSLKDNLSSEGHIKKFARIIKDGKESPDWYGQSGTKYELDIPNNFRDLYLYFEWQSTQALENNNNAIILARLLNGTLRNYYLVSDWGITPDGNIYRQTYYGTAKDGYPSSAWLNAPSQTTIFNESYFSYKGRDSFWIRYKGNGSVASIKLQNSKITLTVDGVDTVISVNETDSIKTIVQEIVNVSELEAGIIDCGTHKYSEVLHSDTLSIPLIYTLTPSEDKSFTDKLRIYIPYVHDETWHSCEILLRLDESKMYINHDGFTAITDITSRMDSINALMKAQKTSVLSLGADYGSDNVPVRFRNFELEVNSCGSAEIVEFRCPIPNASGTPYDRRGIMQMISNHNPKVIIYEGHGELVGIDSDYPVDPKNFISETAMSCTTDRLMQIFAYAKSKGYEFVSIKDIIDWKINGKPLPKRSMTVVFDDFRIENFIDLEKRQPFMEYNMLANMLIVTNDASFNKTYTINGKEYTGEECIEQIRNAGWYLINHTKDHRMTHTLELCEDRIALLKEDALSADKHLIENYAFAYGGDNIKFYEIAGLKSSVFQIFINGMGHDYICKGVNNFRMNRVDMGLRLSIDDVLAPLG